MSASVLYMSMSLDGYIAGPDAGPGNPGGDGFMRLHEWLATADGDSGRPPGPAGEMHDEMEATGAVLVGRRTAEQAGHYQGNHHGVPIVVVSHQPPPPSVASYPSVTYVTDGIESAMTQAKTAAGDRDVMVHARTRRSGRCRPLCWTSCRFTSSRCCSVRGSGCSTPCRRTSSWRSPG